MALLNKLRLSRIRQTTLHALLLGVTMLPVMPAYAIDLKDVFSNASTQQGAFLPVSEAFSVTANMQDNTTLHIHFDITDGHYVYQDKIKLALPEGVTASAFTFNKQPSFVDDPAFGRVAVFEQKNVTATTTLTNTNQSDVNAPVTISWQGCAKAGLCYPPEKIKININLLSPPVVAEQAESIEEALQQKESSVTDTTDVTTAKTRDTEAEVSEPQNSNHVNANTNTATPVVTTSQNAKLQPFSLNNTGTEQNHASQPKKMSVDEQASTLQDNTVTNRADNTVAGANSKPVAQKTEEQQTSAKSIANDSDNLPSETILIEEVDAEHGGKKSYVLNHTPNLQDELLKEQSMLNDPFGLQRHPWFALVLIFIAGLGLSFNACVLPMLPIVANIVARQGEVTTKRSIQLSGSYALGVAVAYGILGGIIAYIGQSVGVLGWLQNPIILLVFVAIFVLLGLYMLELINVRLPARISQFLNRLSQAGNSKLGSISGSFLVGLLSALVVSPCVSAPLSGVLVAVATLGNVLLGFFALFVLGLGLTLPLVIFAGTQGKFMPKAGEWMNWVKQGFAYLMFALALLILERVFVSPIMLLLWAAWFAVFAYWLWSWRGKLQMLTQTFAMVMALWAAALLYGASQGNTNSWQPLRGVFKTEEVENTTVTIMSIEELDDILRQHPKVLIDLVADWCIECRIMEETLFAQPPAELADWQVVKFDITDTNEQSKQILSRYQLFGPPALMYYVEGQLITTEVGEVERDVFEDGLKAINKMADAN